MTSDDIKKIEENVCDYLPERLRKAVVAKNECPKIAQDIRDVYFDGKGFDSSKLHLAHVSNSIYIIQLFEALIEYENKCGILHPDLAAI